MKKSSFFLGGALLLVSLFTTSCKEVLGSLDNPVSSYLTVNVADVTIPTGDTFQLKSETINSDNPITYKSSDETVATVDANGLVTGVADGEATILVSVAASQYYQEGTKEVKVAVKRPLTFEALEDGGINVEFNNSFVPEKPIIYSINGGDKQEITSYTWIPVKKGDKVEFESANERLTSSDWSWGLAIRPGSQCAVYGNVMSMISPDGNYHTNKTITQPFALSGLLVGYTKWDEIPAGSGNWQFVGYNTVSHDKYKLLLPATTLTTGCYYEMFYNTGITETPELPATELADYCYQWMFESCGNLTKASALPASELKEGCYGSMFYNCSSLEKAPALPATKLANWCYQQMFRDCTSLKTAPALPATELKDYCYDNMFRNTGLTKAPALPADKLGEFCYRSMFYDCKDLAQAPALPATKMKYYSYAYMFSGCTALKEAPALPATELKDYCYDNMFRGSGLTKAPALPATKLGEYCYRSMFYNCTDLEEAPALPATNLAPYCYTWMFASCTNLKKAPELPATELTDGCYDGMFSDCVSLAEAPELKAESLPAECYMYMFQNCYKLSKVTCMAKEMTGYNAISFMLAGAGTDASVTERTFTRSTSNNNWAYCDTWDWVWDINDWRIPSGWTFDPAITASSAPARRAAASVKGTPIKTPTFGTKSEMRGGEDTGGVKAPAKTNI